MDARQHLLAKRGGRHLVHGLQLLTREGCGAAAQRRPDPELTIRAHSNLEWKECAACGQVGAAVTAPVDEAHEEMTVRENGVQRREQPPGRVAIEGRGVFERRGHLPGSAIEGVDVGRVREVGRHFLKRALQFRQVGPQSATP